MMILGPIHASTLCHTIHHKSKDMSIINRESWTKHQPCTSCAILCSNHAQNPCTSTMYINTIQYTIIYHQWSVSSICQEYVPIVYQPYASTNMPTMCLKQVSYHSWYASTMNHFPQPCISTINLSTKNHNKCLNYIIPYIMYQSKCINHAPNLNKMNYNQYVFPYMYAI